MYSCETWTTTGTYALALTYMICVLSVRSKKIPFSSHSEC